MADLAYDTLDDDMAEAVSDALLRGQDVPAKGSLQEAFRVVGGTSAPVITPNAPTAPAEAVAPKADTRTREQKFADKFRSNAALIKQQIAERNRTAKIADDEDRLAIKEIQDRIADRKAKRIEKNESDTRLVKAFNAASEIVTAE